MEAIYLDEFTNGYTVVGIDPKDGKFLSEIHEMRLDQLLALKFWVDAEIVKERTKLAQ